MDRNSLLIFSLLFYSVFAIAQSKSVISFDPLYSTQSIVYVDSLHNKLEFQTIGSHLRFTKNGFLYDFSFHMRIPENKIISSEQYLDSYYSGSVGLGWIINRKKRLQFPIVLRLGYLQYQKENEDLEINGFDWGGNIKMLLYISNGIALKGSYDIGLYQVSNISGEKVEEESEKIFGSQRHTRLGLSFMF